MAEEFRPVLLEDIAITWPGFVLRRMALNRHMPRVEKFGEHVHDHSQVLLYLGGRGVQRVGDSDLAVGRGTALRIPPGVPHRFRRERRLRPVCLAVDFDGGEESEDWAPVATLSPMRLAAVERWLVDLHREHDGEGAPSVTVVSLVLRIFASVAEGLNEVVEESAGPVRAAVEEIVDRVGLPDIAPQVVAGEFGCSLDHLNRRLRAEAGTSVGGLIRRGRLDTACRLLRSTERPVGEIGSEVGMDDANYFARWFRTHMGFTPSGWRRAMTSESGRITLPPRDFPK